MPPGKEFVMMMIKPFLKVGLVLGLTWIANVAGISPARKSKTTQLTRN